MEIVGMGGCVVSNHITNGEGLLKWCVRDKSCHPADNGWRFLADNDDEEYLSKAGNMSIWNFETIVDIEPAILAIYDMPVGTDLTLIRKGRKKYFVDTETGERVL